MESKSKKLTFPKSDTISGPGTYEGEIISPGFKKKNDIPAVATEEPYDEFGHGTAKDVTSQPKTPPA